MDEHIDFAVFTLTIEGIGLDFDKISNELKLRPNHIEQRGEQSKQGLVYQIDRWHHFSPIALGLSPAARLRWLRKHLQPATDFLHELRAKADVRIEYIAYTYGNGHRAQFDPAGLALFADLDIPLNLKFVKFDLPQISDEELEAALEGVEADIHSSP